MGGVVAAGVGTDGVGAWVGLPKKNVDEVPPRWEPAVIAELDWTAGLKVPRFDSASCRFLSVSTQLTATAKGEEKIVCQPRKTNKRGKKSSLLSELGLNLAT